MGTSSTIIPPPPSGFTLEDDAVKIPPPPSGFTLEGANPTQAKPASTDLTPPNAGAQMARDSYLKIPHELRGYTPSELAQPSGQFNYRTGQQYTVGQQLTPVPVLDAPVQGVQQIGQGIAQMAQPSAAEKLRGAGKVFVGGVDTLTPAFAGLGVTAPVDAALWYALSKATGEVGRGSAKLAGASPEDQQEIGQVSEAAPMLAGGVKIAEGKLSDAIDTHNARAAELIAQDVRQGQGAEMAQNIVGEAGIPLQNTDGWKVVPMGATAKGRPQFQVIDANGKTIYAGNGRAVQDWLSMRGVERTPVTPPPPPGFTEEQPGQAQVSPNPQSPTEAETGKASANKPGLDPIGQAQAFVKQAIAKGEGVSSDQLQRNFGIRFSEARQILQQAGIAKPGAPESTSTSPQAPSEQSAKNEISPSVAKVENQPSAARPKASAQPSVSEPKPLTGGNLSPEAVPVPPPPAGFTEEPGGKLAPEQQLGILKLSGDDLRNALADPDSRSHTVGTAVSWWLGGQNAQHASVPLMQQLLQETLPGGQLEELHPGSVTVYRGHGDGEQTTREGVSSFSVSPDVAQAYANAPRHQGTGQVRQLAITPETPAIALDKLHQVVSPDFDFNAMHKAGLAADREIVVLENHKGEVVVDEGRQPGAYAPTPQESTGPHGPIFSEYAGRPAEAIGKLQQEQTGEVPGAWNHPELGPIDLVWGKPGNPKKNFDGGYGLAHIIAKHVDGQQDLNLDHLAAVIPHMKVVSNDGRTAQLQSSSHDAAVRLNWLGKEKRWLITAYERPPNGGSLDVPASQPSPGDGHPPSGGLGPSAGKSTVVPDTHATERLPLGGTSSVEPGGTSAQTSAEDHEYQGLPHPRMGQFVDNLVERLQNNGRIKDTPELVFLAKEWLGDSLTSGKYEVKDLYDALETAVNRIIANDPNIMRRDPHEALRGLHHVLNSLPTQTARTKDQKEFQQFSTPPTLSYLAAKAADIKPTDVVLEPSAGTGSLAAFAKAAGAHVETNELDPGRAAFLRLQGYEPSQLNAEHIRDLRPNLKPTVVLMNPPFSASAGRKSTNSNSIGFQHVLSALQTLPPGGRLVAILGRGASFDHPTAGPLWAAIAKQGARVRANIGLDGSNYSKYGTTFDNRLIIIDKTPATGEKPVTGEFKDLNAAYEALRPVINSRPEAESRGAVDERGSGDSVRSGEPLPASEAGNGERRPGRRGPGQASGDVDEARPTEDARSDARSGSTSGVEPSGERSAPDRAGADVSPGGLRLKTGEAEETPVERDGTYQEYRPAKLRTGVSHSQATGTGLVETSAMASVEPPDLSYSPHLPEKIVNNGHVTDAQLEAVAYAGQAQEHILPDGQRMGFLIGDGTGVGKGTEAAAIALDNWNQGRRKILWLSFKSGLIKQAQRDLDWVQAPFKAKLVNDWDFGVGIAHEGVVFATYNMLHQVSAKNKGTRMEQIVKWQPDVILMDESHAAKNAVAAGGQERGDDETPEGDEEEGGRRQMHLRGTSSKAGEAVVDLQKQVPDARVTYFSATAFTDTRNLGYATRLGLWGKGTAFPKGFREFNAQIDEGGLGMMELIAKEMKAAGNYVSRSMSFKGVSYREVQAPLSPAQREMYDAAVRAWQLVLANIDKAIDATAGEDNDKARGLQRMRAVSQFWSANQRFYRGLITAMKVPAAIEATQQALDEGKSVFLDLVSTGEAETVRQLEKAAQENLSFEDLDLSAKQTLIQYIENCFPIHLVEDYEDENGSVRSRPVLDANGNPAISQAAKETRDALIDEVKKIQLPQSPLDQFIDYFGPEAVAEISGRKSRVTQDPKSGRPLEIKRVKPKGSSARDINDYERQQFQDGKKRIAIASGAGGTGFDFHSDKRIQNQQRRVHIVLEPSWSADQQMQKFGRTHRTNQANAPEYVLIASDLGGEKRFISAIASRIASLGALTRGERKAGGGGAEMLAKYNIEGTYGEAATGAFFQILQGEGGTILANDVAVRLPQPPKELADNAMDMFRQLGAVKESEDGIRIERMNTKRFLNRVLNLPTGLQREVFDYFMQLFEHIIETLKREGAFDEGTIELKAISSKIKNREVLRENANGASTNLTTVDAEFPVERNEWLDAVSHVNSGDSSNYHQQQFGGIWRNKRSGKVWAARKARTDKTDEATGQVIPTMAMIGTRKGSYNQISVDELRDKHERIPGGPQARGAWEGALSELPATEHHDVHLVTGSVLPVWNHIRSAASGGNTRAVRVLDEQGHGVTGVQIPATAVAPLRDRLQGAGDFSPAAILHRLWQNNERIPLSGASLSTGRVMGERAIIIQPAKTAGRETLDKLGIRHIETASSVRFYLPYSDEPSTELQSETQGKLQEVLNAFPPAASQERTYTEGLHLGTAENMHRLFTGQTPGEPARTYSALGALKSNIIRNLSQLEEASPEAHRAAVQAASSHAQAAALIRSAWPKVLSALGNVSPENFRRALIESRLQGVQQRWHDLAAEAEDVPVKELADWVLSGPLELLAALSEDEDGSLAERAAELAHNLQVLNPRQVGRNATARLRSLVVDAFEEAAERVHHMMAPDEFQQLTQNPGFQRALAIYKREVETPLAENHDLNEGVFSDALGPLKTYYPLTPLRANEKAAAVMGARRGFKKPGNISNKFTTGLADDYDAGMEAFSKKIEAAIRVNDKAAAIKVLQEEGILRKLKPNERADTMYFGGREFSAKVVSVGPARTIHEHGKIIQIPEQRAAIPEPFYHELKPILEPDAKMPPGLLKRLVSFLNEMTLAGPAEAVIHSHNLLGTLIANTPFLGPELATKTIGNTPFTKVFTAIAKLASTDPMDEHAVRDLQQMAKLGLLPERFGTETYSQHYADLTGATKKIPGLQWGPILYGPKGIDVRARLLMYRLANTINPNATSQEVYKFVNQLGNYTEALQGHLERALKRTGFSRFVTAGSTMLRNGIDAWLGVGSGSGPGGTFGGSKWNRVAQMLSGGAIGVIAAWIIAYKAMTGKWPWEDSRATLGKIPAPKELRNSKVGRALWGHNSKVGYLNFFGFASPLVSRGARALGIDGAFNTAREGGNWKQVAEASKRDVANSLIHPVAGPAARFATVLATGKQPYLVGDSDQGGSKLLTVLPKKSNIGAEIPAALKQINSFYGNVGAATGFEPNPGNEKATAEEVVMKAIIEMTGLTSPASNPNAARTALAHERAAHH